MAQLLGMAVQFGLNVVLAKEVLLGQEFISFLFSILPMGWQQDLTAIDIWWKRANAWFALGYMFGLIGIYLDFWASFVVVKMTLKLIPTIG